MSKFFASRGMVVLVVFVAFFVVLFNRSLLEVSANELSAPATTDCTQVTEIPQSECETLIEFYNATNGDNWFNNDGWNETNTPCTWYGVSCSEGHVNQLTLSDNNLSGSITDLQLPYLEILELSYNQLTGGVPDFSNLPNLISL
jgi:hypothetical protein